MKGLDGQGNGTLIESYHTVTADRVVTGITHLKGLAQFILRFNDEDLNLVVFQRLGNAQISIRSYSGQSWSDCFHRFGVSC